MSDQDTNQEANEVPEEVLDTVANDEAVEDQVEEAAVPDHGRVTKYARALHARERQE